MADLKMVYESAEAMEEAVRRTAEYFGELAQRIRQVADQIDGGALINPQGRAWAEALRGRVMNGLVNAQGLLEELSRDLRGAMGDLRQGDQDGSSQF
jgi:hypothetical protein